MIGERETAMEDKRKERVAGIDVSKAGLDVWMKPGPAEGYENSKEGIRALVKRLGRERVALAVYEPTGGYERQLEGELREGEIKAYRAHPNKVRAFARASGKEAKTDGIDAEVLALYGEVFGEEGAKEEEWDEERRDLQDIVRRRRQLVDQRAREKNRLEKRQSRKAEASIKRAIRWNTNEIGRLDREYKKALEKSRGLRQRAELYQSVRGVGELTAATLVAELPELGQGDGKGLTSLVGLAPWARDSGRQRGYRSIQGGRGTVRKALYLAALSAIGRRESKLGRFYQRLRRRGKPGKVALVAVMRKLLMQLHAVARRGSPWLEDYSPAT